MSKHAMYAPPAQQVVQEPCSSESERSESKDCFPVVCRAKCGRKVCTEECRAWSGSQIANQYANAVVSVDAEFILISQASGIIDGPTVAATALANGVRADIILNGSGFFVKGHYIVCPAHLVLLPPSLSSAVLRYPFLNAVPAIGFVLNQYQRASRILVTVTDVNNKGAAYVYEAELIGVDGAGDIAVLRVDAMKQWNRCNPCIEKCHPYFTLGSSRAMKDGEKAFLIGDYIGSVNEPRRNMAYGAIVEGLVADHRHLDHSGWQLAETILVSANAYSFSSGMPILNGQGQVIGMQTTDIAGIVRGTPIFDEAGTPLVGTAVPAAPGEELRVQQEGFGYVGGPSEFFLRRIIRFIIRGTCSQRFQCQLTTVFDPVGAFYVYRKGYLGVAYDVFLGQDYDTFANYTSRLPTTPQAAPQVRLDAAGNFLNGPNRAKDVVGIRVLGLAGLNPADAVGIANGAYYVPGGGVGLVVPPLPANADLTPLPASPLLGLLTPGDVITSIKGAPLGDLGCQIAPSLVTWRLCPLDTVEIGFRRGGAATAAGGTPFDSYEFDQSTRVALAAMPPVLDYPWYRVNIFPQVLYLAAQPLGVVPYPAFNAPLNQDVVGQLPQFFYGIGGGIFHPAI